MSEKRTRRAAGVLIALLALLPVAVPATALPTERPTVAPLDPALPQLLSDEGFEDVAILVLDPAHERSVLEELERRDIDHHLYDRLHQVAAVLSRDDVEYFARLPGVEAIHPNEILHGYLDNAAPYVGAPILWNTYQVRGGGVTILIVDSGVDGAHPDVRYGQNLIENVVPTRQVGSLVGGYQEDVPSSDSDGHGTHVAGIAGGTALASGSGDPERGRYRGIAHEADLIGFQAGVLSPGGEVQFESVTVLEAFNYALAKKETYNIRVVSNSWGTMGSFDPRSPINQATLNLYKAGLVVTFAAGNDGAVGEGTLNRYCVAPWVLCVAAGDRLNQRAPFSSIGTDSLASGHPYDHPDIMAPGIGIVAARAGADGSGALGGLTGTGGSLYATKSGTSMATPVVSGVAALLLSKNPKLSPDDVYDILTASADPLAMPVWETGAGYVNALDAYKVAEEVQGGLDEFLTGRAKYGGEATGDPDFSDDPVTVGLGRGYAKAFTGSDVTILEFLGALVGTPQGLIFLVGTAAFFVLAFGFRRRF